MTSSDLIALNYLDDFYANALSHSDHLVFATGYKGFDDTIADWTENRHMDQQCGQTWIESMSAIGEYYNADRQLPAFQLVTWNDYEEGTAIETGIDNCLSVNAAINGNVVSWSSTGNENTLDHYTVFISSDGQNLMSLGDYMTSTHALDLSTFGFNAGTYKVYVKAVGKPSIVNHMSGAVSYTASGAPPAPGMTDFMLSAPAGSATVTKGNAANYTFSLVPAGTSSGTSVVFSCSGLPEGAACTFNPVSAVLGSAPVPMNVIISTSDGIHAGNHLRLPFVYAITFPVLGMVLIGFLGSCNRRKLFLAFLVAFYLLLVAGCGGGTSSSTNQADIGPTTSSTNAGTPAGSYTVTITGTAGAIQRSTNVSLTVQ